MENTTTIITDELLLEDEFEDYAAECESALRHVMADIMNIHTAIERSGERSPFDTIDHRIKSFQSTVNKCKLRDFPLSIDGIKQYVRDVAGVRIITPFRDDIYAVEDYLKHTPGINIARVKDYVAEPKDNGYSSLHLATEIQIYLPNIGSKIIPVEIQIRDKAMDMWATIEHVIRYKNDNPSPEAKAKFREIAKMLAQFDELAMDLRDFVPDEGIIKVN